MSLPRGECVTSGWNCNPHICVDRFSIATKSAFDVPAMHLCILLLRVHVHVSDDGCGSYGMMDRVKINAEPQQRKDHGLERRKYE